MDVPSGFLLLQILSTGVPPFARDVEKAFQLVQTDRDHGELLSSIDYIDGKIKFN